MRYFHGSMAQLDSGDTLTPRSNYAENWGETSFYLALEHHRPEGMRGHKDAVFMCGDPDDVDLAGGGTEWMFEVIPSGSVNKHDLNWSSEVSRLISDGFDMFSPEVALAAANYWDGIPNPNESVWEYTADSALIIKVDTFERFSSSNVHSLR